MKKFYDRYQNSRRRLARIERKCDAILALLRPRIEERELDRTISLMHIQARRMKAQALQESRRYRDGNRRNRR